MAPWFLLGCSLESPCLVFMYKQKLLFLSFIISFFKWKLIPFICYREETEKAILPLWCNAQRISWGKIIHIASYSSFICCFAFCLKKKTKQWHPVTSCMISKCKVKINLLTVVWKLFKWYWHLCVIYHNTQFIYISQTVFSLRSQLFCSYAKQQEERFNLHTCIRIITIYFCIKYSL